MSVGIDIPRADVPAHRLTMGLLTRSVVKRVAPPLTTAIAVLLLGASVAHAEGWTAPSPLDADVHKDSWVAISDNGDATAAWQQEGSSGAPAARVVRAATRPAGGEWSEPVTLGPGGGYSPSVAMDDAGHAYVVWERRGSGSEPSRVLAARRPAGGAWPAEPEILATASGGSDFYAPVVVADDAGRFTATWTMTDGAEDLSDSVWSSTRSTAGVWSDPNQLDTDSACIFPAVDGEGAVTVLWRRQGAPDRPWEVRAAVRSPEGAWSAPKTVQSTDRQIGYCPELAVNAAGEAIAAWRTVQNDPGEPVATVLWTTRRSAGGAWSTPAPLENEGVTVNVAIDGDGDATAIWQSAATEPRRLRAAWQPAGGAWSEPVTLDDDASFGRYDTDGYQPQQDLDAAGNVTALWSHARSSIRTATMSPEGSWSEPLELGTSGDIPALAVNASGAAAAVWIQSPNEEAVYVATRPGLAGPSVTLEGSATPSSAQVGAPVTVDFGVANPGPGSASAVRLVISVPAGLRDARATPSTGTCTSASGGFDCTLGEIPEGGSAQVRIDASVAQNGPSTLTATAKSGGRSDPDATANVTVDGRPGEPPADPALAPSTPAAPLSTGPAPLPPGPTAGETLLSCMGAEIAILDVRMGGGRVRIAGQARRALSGRTVELLVQLRGRPSKRTKAGSATILVDGSFVAAVKPPPRARRRTAAYVARVGSTVSRAIELKRRMTMTIAEVQGAFVLLRGRISRPLPRTPQPVVITRQTDCGRPERLDTVRPRRNGSFSVRVPLAQAPARAAIYRAETRVPVRAGGRRTARTFTLPAAVALT